MYMYVSLSIYMCICTDVLITTSTNDVCIIKSKRKSASCLQHVFRSVQGGAQCGFTDLCEGFKSARLPERGNLGSDPVAEYTGYLAPRHCRKHFIVLYSKFVSGHDILLQNVIN